MEKPHIDTDAEARTAALFVSLYVVILAFFILLTSNAQFDDKKTRIAIQSVNEAFSTEQELHVIPFTSSVGNEAVVMQMFESIQTAVATQVPLEEIRIITSGNVMRMTMPVSSLYHEGQANLRSDRSTFYRTVSKIVSKWQKGAVIHLSYLQGVEKPLARGITAATALEVQRAGSFARGMENRGVPPETISIGVEQGHPDTLVFEFTIISAPQRLNESPPAKEQAP